LQRTPGLGLSALSSTRPGTVVPEAIRHSHDHHPPASVPDDHRRRFVPASSTTWSVWPPSTAYPCWPFRTR